MVSSSALLMLPWASWVACMWDSLPCQVGSSGLTGVSPSVRPLTQVSDFCHLFDLGFVLLSGRCSNDCSKWKAFRGVRDCSRQTRDGSDQGKRTSTNPCGRFAQSWGSRGREFKSRQPDRAKYLVRQQIHLSKYFCFMIVFAVDHLF
jgi:hypothetical protein